MPRFLAPITVDNEFVTGNETISGNETIIGVTSGRESYWSSVDIADGLSADYGNFVNNVSAAAFYGDGSNLTNINASNISSGTLSATRLPAFNGDITTSVNTSVSTTVVKLQGYPISTATPSNGQILQWNGTAWIPGSIATGGSGGGGLTFFLNQGLSAQSPTTNLPLTAHELGRTGLSAQTIVNSLELSRVSYDLVAGFVSDVLDPDTTAIPAGIWDFNLWAYSDANATDPLVIQALIYKYDGVNAPTLLSTSDDTTLTNGGIFYPLVISCLLTQTPLLTSDRIYVEFRAKAHSANHHVTFGFGGNTPTHVHTTLPSVGGSGLVKVVNGIYQTPASLLVDVDVDANAQIAQSKISGLTTSLAGKVNTADIIAISSGGTGQTTAAAALAALGGFPIAGGTLGDGLTATSGTFTTYLSSPSISGTFYGDIFNAPHYYVTCRANVNQVGVMNIVTVPNTFTYNATTAIPAIDGVTPSVGDTILLGSQTSFQQNGPWRVINAGSAGVSAVLERPNFFSGIVKAGTMFTSSRGNNFQGSTFNLYTSPPGANDITVGLSAILFGTSYARATSNATNASNTFTGTQTLAVGSTTLAPLRFQAGTLLNTPVAHSVEWDGTLMYNTTLSSVRTTQAAFIAGPLSATGVVPALSSTSGVAGQMAFDSNYLYICTSASTWKRTALSSW